MKRKPTPETPVYRYDGPLRTASGEYPTGSPSGHHFSAYQGEWFTPDNERLRGIDAQVGVLPLNNCKWLGHPRHGFAVYDAQFETREAALRASVAEVIGRWRRNARGKGLQRYSAWPVPQLIAWARSLVPPRPFAMWWGAAA